MRVIIQRVKWAEVFVDEISKGHIDNGLLILLGIETEDTQEDADWLCNKLSTIRLFADKETKMNLDIHEAAGQFMVISQFTLFASCKKGNRPSFIKAARPEQAIPLYNYFLSTLERLSGKAVARGIFGADMQVSLLNDGPVTLFLDSKQRE